jgi:hypothetical protein
VTELLLCCSLLLLQPERPKLASDLFQFAIYSLIFVLVMLVAMFFVFRAVRPKVDSGAASKLKDEFERSKETLLLAAQAKKAAREVDEAAQRHQEAEEKERELLRQNVDPQRVIGQLCPLSGLEMMADQELVIDPYTGSGYHLSSFLHDWPAGRDRPKYVYRYPQGTVVASDQLVREY